MIILLRIYMIHQSINHSINQSNQDSNRQVYLKFSRIRVNCRHLTEHFQCVVVLQCIVKHIINRILGSVKIFQIEQCDPHVKSFRLFPATNQDQL